MEGSSWKNQLNNIVRPYCFFKFGMFINQYCDMNRERNQAETFNL